MLAANGLADDIHIEEGSGISRGNRFTARGLARVLTMFAPHATLLRRGDGTFFKTGTFSGVRTLATQLKQMPMPHAMGVSSETWQAT